MPPQKRQRRSAEDVLGLAPRRTAEEILGITSRSPAPPVPVGTGENFAIAAERGYRKTLEPAINALGEVTEGMKVGDFGPAWRMVKEAALGTYEALKPPNPQTTFDQSGQPTGLRLRPENPTLAKAQAERSARYAASPEGRNARERLGILDARAAADPSISGKIIRGTTEFATGAAPALATAIATRGSIPLTSLVVAAQSANNPAQIGPNVALGTLPIPGAKMATNAVRRVLGRGAAQIAEAEAAPAVKEAIPRVAEAPPIPAPAIQAQPPVAAPPSALSRAIGKSAEDVTNVNAADIGLESKFAPSRSADAVPTQRSIPIDDIALGRDTLNKGRLYQVQQQLEEGMKLPGETYKTPGGSTRRVEPVVVHPDPENPGKYIVSDDGNHRIALLKLYGYKGKVPTVAWENPSPALDSAFSKLGTNNVDEIGDMIANANRRYNATRYNPELGAKVKLTPEELAQSAEDFAKLNRLTPEEQDALANILPARTVSPVTTGGKARDISDIANTEPNPQLDANLRQLEQFFGAQGGETMALRNIRQQGPQAQAAMEAPGLPDFNPPKLGTDLEAPTFGVREVPDAPYTETVGPRLGEEMGLNAKGGGAQVPPRPPVVDIDAPFGGPWANQPVQQEILKGITEVPVPLRQRIVNEALGLLGLSKSLKSTLDVGSLFRQGGILLLRPLQWRQSARFVAQTFRAFKKKNFEAINRAIGSHPDAQLMDNVGLYLSNRGGQGLSRGEEAFLKRQGSWLSEKASKIPGLKHSEQSYTTGLDVQRVQRFEQFKRSIGKAGLSPEQQEVAYKAAAQWINVATGRGSLGAKIDKAFDALNFVLFSPRYVASRLNVLNPVMYARNAMTPGGRVVLKGQMADLAQFAGTTLAVMQMAKAAGADVNLNYNSPDFLKVRFGNHRYDTLAGLQQAVRLFLRVGADIGRAASGEKPKPGQTAIDLGETFLSYKLAPPASVFRNFINQRTPDKKPFTAGGAAVDLVAPMQWWDFVEAYQKEGWGGVGMSLPGAVGVGVQSYDADPFNAAIEKAQPLYSELQRLDKPISDVQRRTNEPDDIFNRRVQMFARDYPAYGLKLVSSPRFKQANDDIKRRALEQLSSRAKNLTTQPYPVPQIVLDADILMNAAESNKRNEEATKKRRGF